MEQIIKEPEPFKQNVDMLDKMDFSKVHYETIAYSTFHANA